MPKTQICDKNESIVPTLPPELWLYILKKGKFTPIELLRFGRISSQHYQLVYHPSLWKKYIPYKLTQKQYSSALYRFFALKSNSCIRDNVFDELKNNFSRLVNLCGLQNDLSPKFEEVLSPLAILLKHPSTLYKLNETGEHQFYFNVAQWQAIIGTCDVDLFNICRQKELKEFKLLTVKQFHFAATEGALDILKLLWVENTAKQQELLESEKYYVFNAAVSNGHLSTAKWLWSIANDAQHQAMFRATSSGKFCKAANKGHLQVMQWLWSISSIQQQKKLQERLLRPFIGAASVDHLPTMIWLWEIADTLGQQIILEGETNDTPNIEYVFHAVVKNDCLQAIRWWWSVLNIKQQQTLLEAGSYRVFSLATSFGNLSILKWLWSIANEQQRQAVLEAYCVECCWNCPAISGPYYGIFYNAAQHGHIAIMEWLWPKFTADQQQDILQVNDFFGFYKVACQGQVLAMEWLWSKASLEQQEGMLKRCYHFIGYIHYAYDHASHAFARLIEDGHITGLDWLWAKASAEQQQLLLQNMKELLFLAIKNEQINKLEWLWSKISHEKQQVMLNDLRESSFMYQNVKEISIIIWLWDHLPTNQNWLALPIEYQQALQSNFLLLLEKKIPCFVQTDTSVYHLQDLENTLIKLKKQGATIFSEEKCNAFIIKTQALIDWIKFELCEQEHSIKTVEISSLHF